MNADTTLQGRHVAEHEKRSICGRVFGGILATIGTLSLLHVTGLMTEAQFQYVIPAGFVVIGAFLLLRK